MKEYWRNLSQREQRLLLIAGVVLALLFLHQAIWVPIIGGAETLHEQATKQQADIQWMRESAQTIRQLQGSGVQARPLGGSLLGVIESSARQQHLANAIQKVQPEGEKNVRLNLKGVAFDELLIWLDVLTQQYGIRISDVSVERQPEAGRVDARLLLESM